MTKNVITIRKKHLIKGLTLVILLFICYKYRVAILTGNLEFDNLGKKTQKNLKFRKF